MSGGQNEPRRHQGAEARLCALFILQISIKEKKKQVSCDQDCTQKCEAIKSSIQIDPCHYLDAGALEDIHLHYNSRHPWIHFPGAVFTNCLILFVKTTQTNNIFFICVKQKSIRKTPASANRYSKRGKLSLGDSIPMISSKVSCKFVMSCILKKWLPPVPAVSGFRSES